MQASYNRSDYPHLAPMFAQYANYDQPRLVTLRDKGATASVRIAATIVLDERGA